MKSPTALSFDKCFLMTAFIELRPQKRLYSLSVESGAISRMFLAAESAFKITAEETLLGQSPLLFLVAAAALYFCATVNLTHNCILSNLCCINLYSYTAFQSPESKLNQ